MASATDPHAQFRLVSLAGSTTTYGDKATVTVRPVDVTVCRDRPKHHMEFADCVARRQRYEIDRASCVGDT